jgi:glycine dehydrogenase
VLQPLHVLWPKPSRKQARWCSNKGTFLIQLRIVTDDKATIRKNAEARGINFHYHADNKFSISLDETTTSRDVLDIIAVFTNEETPSSFSVDFDSALIHIPGALIRTSSYLTHKVFNTYHQ